MKKYLIILIASLLFGGSIFAQTHNWTYNNANYSDNMTAALWVTLDGNYLDDPTIEVAAFVDEEVRMSEFMQDLNPSGSNVFEHLFIWGSIGLSQSGETITFKMFYNNTEYDICPVTVTGVINGEAGTMDDPLVLNFYSPITKDITAYTPNTPNNETPDHYYLIASPIGQVSPTLVGQMLNNSYDLYYYDQTQDKEWINYEGSNGNFSLEPGKGYLYANSQNVTLTFAGAPYSGNGEVPLVYDAGVNQNTALIGWNLVGNPFAQPAYIADNRSFYRMNEGGTGLISASGAIAAMEGVFVKAADADDNNITFSTEQPSRSGEQLTVNLSQNRGAAIDRVIIGFSEGDVLPKFMLNENNAKLYIPQGNVDYAVVRSAGVGELPLNFKASKNGTYTLSIDTENMEMNYLHLIDNMTGMDIDLLQTPSYSFEASTRDYASRFRLVFAGTSTDATSSDAFAFYSNGNWIINNPSTGSGVATLQIVDVNGHLLCNEQINGCCSKSFEAAPGVYMLRLINGENVKTQKIVVR
ncbi:MAG: T9SS type A sorting domain-containing protein [Bacteroidales bacterium]|nr:T9SS type A sorting domain-containing protein [Bacteroidales bacterium]